MNFSFVIQVKKYISISRSATVILKLPVAFSYGINVIFQSKAVANSRTLVAITAHVNAWYPGGQIPNYKNKYFAWPNHEKKIQAHWFGTIVQHVTYNFVNAIKLNTNG